MDELRKVQKIGYSTLSVSIPKKFAKEIGLTEGDSILFKEDADGTLRLIPATKASKSSRATIRADLVDDDQTLTRLVVGAYALGYDTIEVAGKEPLDKARTEAVIGTIKRLRGVEVVESDSRHVVAQSFMDPTKFPVDSLIKRLQILVAKSLEDVMEALNLKRIGSLNEVRKVQEEIDELYWLIVRQLLVALNRRELASDIGIESPLHASGDRVCAKTLDEIGSIIMDIAEELVRLKGQDTRMDPRVVEDIMALGTMASKTFNTTMGSLLTSDPSLIGASAALVEETLEMEKEITHEILETGEHGYARVLATQFAQLARYCNIIIEIASHRLLRKTSRIATIQK